jgi:hypothetical protein
VNGYRHPPQAHHRREPAWKLAFFVWYNLDMDRFVIEFENDWEQLIGRWTWYTFTLIKIEFENDKFTHGYEFYFVLLGLGLRIRYNKASFDKWAADLRKEL